MAVAPTGALFKALTFDGESSRDYGLYITGAGVYNAPEREVEMVTIPGRNGAFALDRGRFENIAVTYPAGIYADTPEDFADAISEARNWLTSKRGYVRLSDDYNPDEYRLAVYKSGLDVKAETLRAGEFDLEFEAMPQRWLTSGEESQAVASGGTITNPTRFAARPLLEVNGYGGITLNGATVSINSGPLGEVLLANSKRNGTLDWGVRVGLSNTASLNTGDEIAIAQTRFRVAFGVGAARELSVLNTTQTATNGTAGYTEKDFLDDHDAALVFSFTPNAFQYGTAGTARLDVAGVLGYTITATGTTIRKSFTMALSVEYDGADEVLFTFTTTEDAQDIPVFDNGSLTVSIITGEIKGDSTKSALGEPAYIDLDTGEAYKLEGGAVVGINNKVTLPGELPELEPGANSISYDSTITALSIVPRWWKV